MPAAAVIPAPEAYIKVVAVKTLVVEYMPSATGLPLSGSTRSAPGSLLSFFAHFIVWNCIQIYYFEKMRVLYADICHGYVSME